MPFFYAMKEYGRRVSALHLLNVVRFEHIGVCPEKEKITSTPSLFETERWVFLLVVFVSNPLEICGVGSKGAIPVVDFFPEARSHAFRLF
jgi:hypothetical protein